MSTTADDMKELLKLPLAKIARLLTEVAANLVWVWESEVVVHMVVDAL
jgi:hypothetical protein